MRAATIMMHTLQSRVLERWQGPPLLLVRPRVSHISWFAFQHTNELLQSGYDAMRESLDDLDELLGARGGVFPRRRITLSVDEQGCIGCGLCAAQAPHLMALGRNGKAFATTPHLEWSPADGAFVRQCPVGAIHVTDRDGTPTPSSAMATVGATDGAGR
jgi:NTE family protein